MLLGTRWFLLFGLWLVSTTTTTMMMALALRPLQAPSRRARDYCRMQQKNMPLFSLTAVSPSSTKNPEEEKTVNSGGCSMESVLVDPPHHHPKKKDWKTAVAPGTAAAALCAVIVYFPLPACASDGDYLYWWFLLYCFWLPIFILNQRH
jgi:hypothetical protein